MYIYVKELRTLFDAIEAYQKSFRRYTKGQPELGQAERNFDEAHEFLVDALNDANVQSRVRDWLEKSPPKLTEGAADSVIEQISAESEVALLEMSMGDNFGFSGSRSREIIKNLEPAAVEFPRIDEIAGNLVKNHERLKHEIEKARHLPRKEKKRRKRDIKRGVFAIVFSAGIGAANLASPPTFVFSYSVTALAFHQGVRDLIGDKPEDD